MTHSLSAAKRQRQSVRRFERNRAVRSAARNAVRKARELITSGASEEAQVAIREATVILDVAARKGILHRNNAARRKSRLMHMYHVAQDAPAEEAPRQRRTRTTAKARAKTSAGKTTGRSTRTSKS